VTTLKEIIKEKCQVDLGVVPQLEDIFLQKLELLAASGPHMGLLSSDTIYSNKESSPQIVGVWLQAIDAKYGRTEGRIIEHDHGAEGVSEIIITEGESVYAGLGTPIAKTKTASVFMVKPGTRHGSDTQSSYGKWISIKFRL